MAFRLLDVVVNVIERTCSNGPAVQPGTVRELWVGMARAFNGPLAAVAFNHEPYLYSIPKSFLLHGHIYKLAWLMIVFFFTLISSSEAMHHSNPSAIPVFYEKTKPAMQAQS